MPSDEKRGLMDHRPPQTSRPSDSKLIYETLLAETLGVRADHLQRELPYIWLELYSRMTPRQTNVVKIHHGTFDYIYDDYATLEATGAVAVDSITEARLVGAIGFSQPVSHRRDDGRLRGWVGPTERTFGGHWDKGHFIGNSIGGAVDGVEANVFLQARHVNRGPYREMERYCARHPGVLCFSRPIYADESARPVEVEFGVLKPSGELWVELFSNQGPAPRSSSPSGRGDRQ
jgi:hypothetical protein